MFFIRKFPGWYAGGLVITITHYTHSKFLLSKFSQIMAKIIIMNAVAIGPVTGHDFYSHIGPVV